MVRPCLNGAQILHRLLKRLLHIATFPDWRLMGIGDAEMTEQSEAWFRIPQPLFWIPVLRVLRRHWVDVAAHALLQSAEVCALWLRTMPIGMPGRTEAASLAVELAKEAQGRTAEGLHFGDKDKVIYEAFFLALLNFLRRLCRSRSNSAAVRKNRLIPFSGGRKSMSDRPDFGRNGRKKPGKRNVTHLDHR